MAACALGRACDTHGWASGPDFWGLRVRDSGAVHGPGSSPGRGAEVDRGRVVWRCRSGEHGGGSAEVLLPGREWEAEAFADAMGPDMESSSRNGEARPLRRSGEGEPLHRDEGEAQPVCDRLRGLLRGLFPSKE